MDKIIIQGGQRLSGTIPISGAKNSALTLLPCALLTEEPLTLRNLPRLADIDGFQHLLNQFGISTSIAGNRPGDFGRVMTLEAPRITSSVAPYELVRKMRASILVLGPMLARMGEATVSLPGGCAIGNRPIDLHLKVLEALGATIEMAAGYVRAVAPDGGLPGGRYSFPVVSVGATENALMAAVLCTGKSVLHNAAREPEIVDLCKLLVAMGAQIEGIGSSDLTIHGVPRLHGATYRVMSDRIEAGSYACAAAITGGEVFLKHAVAEEMDATLQALRDSGVHVEPKADGIQIASDGKLKAVTISTAPYPGFATDMQAQLMAMLCLAEGSSVLTETIFENRYMHVPELNRMGAHIETKGRTAVVHGVAKLTGAEVMATDLRASMSLVIAGLAAEGETQVHRLYHLDRGYERLEEKLALVGAQIERVGGGLMAPASSTSSSEDNSNADSIRSNGKQINQLDLLYAPAISFWLLALYATATERSWSKWNFEQEAFLRLALLVALISVAIMAATHVWQAAAVPKANWWNIGGARKAATWEDIFRMTVGNDDDDPVVFKGGVRHLLSIAKCVAAYLILGSLVIEAATFVISGPILPRLMPDASTGTDGLSANLTALLALIAAVASIYFTYRQLQAKVRADSRQAWINTLRSHIASFIALADLAHSSVDDRPPPKDPDEFTKCRIEMELMLNPSEKDHRLLMYLSLRLAFFSKGDVEFRSIQDVQNIRVAVGCDNASFGEMAWSVLFKPIPEKETQDYKSDYSDLIGYTLRLAHVVLKREWERVKLTR